MSRADRRASSRLDRTITIAAVVASLTAASGTFASQHPAGQTGPGPASDVPTVTTEVRGSITRSDGTPAPMLPVILEVHDGRQIVFREPATSDAAGSVSWPEVPADPAHHARLVATYDGAPYASDTVNVAPGAAVDLGLVVHDVTADGAPLHLDSLHVIVQVEERGLYRVLQFLSVSNTGEAAWAGGRELQDGRAAGIEIPVPAAATAIRPAPFPTPELALTDADAEVRAGWVLDSRPVPPGGRQVAVTYDLVGDETVDVSLALPYPTAAVTLLVGGPAIDAVDVDVPGLRRGESQDIGGDTFALWEGSALQPGDNVLWSIGPPRRALLPRQWALLGLAAAMLLAVAGSWVAPAALRNADDRRDEIVRTLADLDTRYASAEISAADYFDRRADGLEKLLLLEESQASADDRDADGGRAAGDDGQAASDGGDAPDRPPAAT